MAKVLVEYGADIEAKGAYPGIPVGTPLDFAVHFGMVEIVDLLVKRGAKIRTARMAAGTGSLDTLKKQLASLDGNINEEVTDAFRCAVVCDRVNVVDYMLNSGISVDDTIDGGTALHWAAWEAKPEMVRYLLTRGADPARLDAKHKMKPVDWARHRRKEIGPRWGHDLVIAFLEEFA